MQSFMSQYVIMCPLIFLFVHFICLSIHIREEHKEVVDLYLKAAQLFPDTIDSDVQVCHILDISADTLSLF